MFQKIYSFIHKENVLLKIIARNPLEGAQWLSGRVLDSRPRGRGFEPHRRHCIVSLSKNINPSLVLVQPRKTRPFITERLLGRKESTQIKIKKEIHWFVFYFDYAYLIRLCYVTKPIIGQLPLQSICKYSNTHSFYIFNRFR